MLTFLNSLVLSVLAAALIPLLIHLFNKQRSKKILFSSLRFLKNLEKQRLRKVKLYQILLILIRTLIIIFIIVAFSRPTLTGNWSSGGTTAARTTMVIILDDGLNMQRYDEEGRRFNRAIAKLKDIIASAKQDDKIGIIRTSSPQIDVMDSLDVKQIKFTYKVGDFKNALILADKIFADNPNLNKELHIISDFFTFSDQDIGQLENLSEVNLYFEKIGKPGKQNICIDSLVIPNKLLEINKPVNFEVFLRYQSGKTPQNVNIHLFLENQRMAQSSVNINPGENKNLTLSFSPRNTGKQKGYVEIDDDDLLLDNRYYFSLDIPEKIKLLFVDSSPSAYLNAALETINLGSNIDITQENYNTLAHQSFSKFDVICFSNLSSLSRSLIDRLHLFLTNGGGLIFIPGNQINLSSFNQDLSPILGNVEIKSIAKARKKDEFFTIKMPNKNNPFMTGFFRQDDSKISSPQIYQYVRFSRSNQYEEIIQLNSGDPFLLRSRNEKRNVLILSSYPDNQWSDIQFKGIYIPLLVQIIKYAAFNGSRYGQNVIAGEELTASFSRLNSQNLYYLKLPDGDKIKIIPSMSQSGILFNLNYFNKPGNYIILEKEKKKSIISVNVNSNRINSQPYDLRNLEEKFANSMVIEESENIYEIVQQARFGTELWRYAIIAAIILLILEAVFVKKIEGKNKSNL